MTSQQKSQGRGWHHLRQRASDFMRRITNRQGETQKGIETTQKKEAVQSPLQSQDTIINRQISQAQLSATETPSPPLDDDDARLGTWLDAFEQTQSLYPWLARNNSFAKTERPSEASIGNLLGLDSKDLDLELTRNRMGLIVDPNLANSVWLLESRADQYTVRTKGSSQYNFSLRERFSTGHGHEARMAASPPCMSAGLRLNALADDLLHSLGAWSLPIETKHQDQTKLELHSDPTQGPEPSVQFNVFSEMFSFSKPASPNSIISSCSPTQISHKRHENPNILDFTFFPELRQWVQKCDSSRAVVTKQQVQVPQAKCGICKTSNLEIRELQQFDSNTTGEETEAAVVLPCGHMFGKDCLASWRSENKASLSCPTCRADLVFCSCRHAISGLVVGKTADVPLTGPEGGRIPTYCNDCRLSKIQDGCLELTRLIFDDFEATEGECQRAAWHMVPLAVEAAQRATIERVMGSRGWGNTELFHSG